MKIIDVILPIGPRYLEDTPGKLVYLLEILQRHLDTISRILNGRISFGDGTNTDNIQGTFVEVTAGETPDVEFSVSHNTNRIPAGFITVSQDRAGSLYKGGTAWTNSTIYLKSSVASLQARIFII